MKSKQSTNEKISKKAAIKHGLRPITACTAMAIASLLVAPFALANLDPSNSEIITLSSLGQTAQVDSAFGFSLAVANRRVLIGAPEYRVDGVKGGAVFELVHENGELIFNKMYSQLGPEVAGRVEEGDRFGHSLAVAKNWPRGRFIVGVPREDSKKKVDAGMVHFIGFGEKTYHSIDIGDSNLSRSSDNTAMNYFHQGRFNIKGTVEADDRVGNAIAVGDLNADGGVDVIIGAITEDVGSIKNAGSINVVMYDPEYQLDRFGEQYTHFNNSLYSQRVLMGTRNENEYFSSAIAVGDFNSDGANDIAVGAYADVVDGKRAGGVNIIYSESIKWSWVNEGGPALPGNELINQGLQDVAGSPEDGDLFGFALAAYENMLVVGAPGEDLGGKVNSGTIHIFQGKPSKSEGLGLDSIGLQNNMAGGLVVTKLNGRAAYHQQSFTQRTKDVPGASESGDMFGATLAVGDLNDDDIPDIVVASPGEDLKRGGTDYVDAGMITIFYGAQDADGFWAYNGTRAQAISAPSLPAISQATTGMRFGYSLAIGDVNGDGKDDLVIGNGSAQGGWGDKYADTPKTEGVVSIIYQ
tara:strand:- start:5094 stop:6836 length:1743 start_codon:yes stop_codon:yes gene_type:complete